MVDQNNLKENVDSLLEHLNHHAPLIGPSDTFLRVPDASKVAWRNIPSGDGLDGYEDKDMDLARQEEAGLVGGESDLESGGDSDIETLQSAGVLSDVETVRMHLAHLSKLKSAYVSEFDRLRHLLRESRRQYLQNVALEKQTMTSIHSQAKGTNEERETYSRLKALLRYHRHNGRQALLRSALREKRNAAAASESAPSSKERGRHLAKRCCCYSQGSWKCGEQAVPMARHCVKHILEDPHQVLYRACGVQVGGSEPCHTPLIPLPHQSTCVYHTPLPPHPTPLPPHPTPDPSTSVATSEAASAPPRTDALLTQPATSAASTSPPLTNNES